MPRSLGLALALVVLVFAVYARVPSHGFVTWDDEAYVTRNAVVQRGLTSHGMVWAFATPTAPYWHPLTWASHMLDVELFGSWAGGHHLHSVVLHAANTLLLWAFLLHATGARWRSVIAAAVFAVHPLHVESVAWVAERKDVLAGGFWLLAMSAYLRYVRHPSTGRFALVTLLFGLGLMAKPMLVTLPIALLLLDVWPLCRTSTVPIRRLAVEKVPLVALSAVIAALTYLVQVDVGAVGSVPLPLRIANAINSYAVYLRQFVWPTGLTALYPYPRSPPPLWPLAALIVAGCVGAALFTRRSRPWIAVGLLWFLVTLIPVIGLVQVGKQAHADRFMYLPMIGLLLAGVWGVPAPRRSIVRQVLALGIAGLIVSLAVAAHAHTRYWRDSRALWQRALDVTTGNFYAHSALGAELAEAGHAAEAAWHQREALRLQPTDPDAHNELGKLLAEAGDVDSAIEHFTRAVAEAPRLAEAQHNLGVALSRAGRLDDAISALERAAALDPTMTKTDAALGRAYAAAGRFPEAGERLRRALDADPSQVELRALLGNTLAARGDAMAALREFEAVLAAAPGAIEVRYRAAILYVQLGERDRARQHLQIVLATTPEHAGARALLASLAR